MKGEIATKEYVDVRFNEVDERFNEVDKKFIKIDERFDKMDNSLEEYKIHFDKISSENLEEYKRYVGSLSEQFTDQVKIIAELVMAHDEKLKNHDKKFETLGV